MTITPRVVVGLAALIRAALLAGPVGPCLGARAGPETPHPVRPSGSDPTRLAAALQALLARAGAGPQRRPFAHGPAPPVRPWARAACSPPLLPHRATGPRGALLAAQQEIAIQR